MSYTPSPGRRTAENWSYTSIVMAEHIKRVLAAGHTLPEDLKKGVYVCAVSDMRSATSEFDVPHEQRGISARYDYMLLMEAIERTVKPPPTTFEGFHALMAAFKQAVLQLDKPAGIAPAMRITLEQLIACYKHLNDQAGTDRYERAMGHRVEDDD